MSADEDVCVWFVAKDGLKATQALKVELESRDYSVRTIDVVEDVEELLELNDADHFGLIVLMHTKALAEHLLDHYDILARATSPIVAIQLVNPRAKSTDERTLHFVMGLDASVKHVLWNTATGTRTIPLPVMAELEAGLRKSLPDSQIEETLFHSEESKHVHFDEGGTRRQRLSLAPDEYIDVVITGAEGSSREVSVDRSSVASSAMPKRPSIISVDSIVWPAEYDEEDGGDGRSTRATTTPSIRSFVSSDDEGGHNDDDDDDDDDDDVHDGDEKVQPKDVEVEVQYFVRPSQLPVPVAKDRKWFAQEMVFAPDLIARLTLADLEKHQCAVLSDEAYSSDLAEPAVASKNTFRCSLAYSVRSGSLDTYTPDHAHLHLQPRKNKKATSKQTGRKGANTTTTAAEEADTLSVAAGTGDTSGDEVKRSWTADDVLYLMQASRDLQPGPPMILAGRPVRFLSSTNCEMLGATSNTSKSGTAGAPRDVFGLLHSLQTAAHTHTHADHADDERTPEAASQLRHLAARRAAHVSGDHADDDESPDSKRSKPAAGGASLVQKLLQGQISPSPASPPTPSSPAPATSASEEEQEETKKEKEKEEKKKGTGTKTMQSTTPTPSKRGRGRPRKYARDELGRPDKSRPLDSTLSSSAKRSPPSTAPPTATAAAATKKAKRGPGRPRKNQTASTATATTSAASSSMAIESTALPASNVFKHPFSGGLDVDEYFAEHHSSATKTSKNTLARVALSKMTEGDVWSHIKSYKDAFETDREAVASK